MTTETKNEMDELRDALDRAVIALAIEFEDSSRDDLDELDDWLKYFCKMLSAEFGSIAILERLEAAIKTEYSAK